MSVLRPDKPWPDPVRHVVLSLTPLEGLPLTVHASQTNIGKALVEVRIDEKVVYLHFCRDRREAEESARRMSETLRTVGIKAAAVVVAKGPPAKAKPSKGAAA